MDYGTGARSRAVVDYVRGVESRAVVRTGASQRWTMEGV